MTSTERLNILRKGAKVTVRNEDMEAYLNLCPPGTNEKYKLSEVVDFLEEQTITYGIQEQVILDAVEKEIYGIEILVAKGKEKVDGKDGWFEFLFPIEERKGPKILADGSVDYRTLDEVTTVDAGQELVHYHHAVLGENGYDVHGKVLNAFRGKELRLLKMKGAVISEDHLVYLAAIKGMVSYQNDKLIVTNLYEIKEDVDYLTGDISFEGDILVHGNVAVGMNLKATGNITVRGHVEGAQLTAGKDVILENGMQGAGKGKIKAGGNISGKFFEQVELNCNGNVNANSILNCSIHCEGEVIVSGKLGILIGGSVYALNRISATIIGNMAEVKTELNVGLPDSMALEVAGYERKIQALSQNLEQLNQGINRILALESSQKGNAQNLAQTKMQLMRAKITVNSEIAGITAQKEKLSMQMEQTEHAKVVVNKRIYPGTRVTINGVTTQINDIHSNVTVKRKGSDICLFANE